MIGKTVYKRSFLTRKIKTKIQLLFVVFINKDKMPKI